MIKKLFIFVFIFICKVFALEPHSSEEESMHEEKLDHIMHFPVIQSSFGDGRSYENGYQSIKDFIIFNHPKFGAYSFLDIRVHRLDKGKIASNIGVGWRSLSIGIWDIIGLSLYYDLRHFSNKNLNQMGLSFEFLGPKLDLRINGYLPFGASKIFNKSSIFTYPGGYSASCSQYYSKMSGFDLEVGRTILRNQKINVFVGLGAYYYYSCDPCNQPTGVMGRLSTQILKNLMVQGLFTYDPHFGPKAQAEIRLHIPFHSLSSGWKNRFQPVERNEILIAERLCCWNTNF